MRRHQSASFHSFSTYGEAEICIVLFICFIREISLHLLVGRRKYVTKCLHVSILYSRKLGSFAYTAAAAACLYSVR